jgi:hypothetical protein
MTPDLPVRPLARAPYIAIHGSLHLQAEFAHSVESFRLAHVGAAQVSHYLNAESLRGFLHGNNCARRP